jgi:4-carboxymuconolactone decarboxylase
MSTPPADRMPPLDESALSPQQRNVMQAVLNGPRGRLEGPFIALLRSPGLMASVQQVGAYLRYESALPPRIREFAILHTARAYGSQPEWAIHQPLAVAAGLAPLTIAALAEARRPDMMPEDETATHDMLTELAQNRCLSDTTYTHIVRLFGEAGLLDLVGIAGYYGLLALVMNTARTPPPAGQVPHLPALL